MTTTGVSVESYAAQAAFAGSGFDANYPVANLADLWRSSQPARHAAGSFSFTATLGAPRPISCVALVNHSLVPGDHVRVQCGAYDSGVVAVWPGAYAAGYRAVRPFVFPEVTTATVTVSITAAGSVDIGALEIARFWQWPGISPGAEVGFAPTGTPADFVGGGSSGDDQPLVRIYNGQIDRLAMTIAATRGIDFQGLKGKAQPFVFVEDYDDPDSWARTCFLARNNDLPPLVGAVYRHDTFQFRLREWLR